MQIAARDAKSFSQLARLAPVRKSLTDVMDRNLRNASQTRPGQTPSADIKPACIKTSTSCRAAPPFCRIEMWAVAAFGVKKTLHLQLHVLNTRECRTPGKRARINLGATGRSVKTLV